MTTGPADEPADSRTLHTAAGCFYSAMLVGAVVWMWWRDRQHVLFERAVGAHGVAWSAGTGLAAGLLAAAMLAVASRRIPAVLTMERRIAQMFGPLRELSIVWLSLLGALAEEMFFRLAVQDLAGLTGSVALYTLMNTGPGFWAWTPIAALSGLLFGLLVELGCGLLAATTAHALMTYLSLRRILPS